MHGRRLARMSWKKWSEIPDIKPRKKQQKEQRGWSQTPTEEPRLPALPYWLPSSPAFRPPLALFSSLLFDMLCLCPSLTQLNPVSCSCLLLALGSPLSSTPRPVPHTLQFFSSLPSQTITLESIQGGLCYAASLSSLTNASVQRIKGRLCWLRHKPFPWLLITKWSWLLTTEADRKTKHMTTLFLYSASIDEILMHI